MHETEWTQVYSSLVNMKTCRYQGPLWKTLDISAWRNLDGEVYFKLCDVCIWSDLQAVSFILRMFMVKYGVM